MFSGLRFTCVFGFGDAKGFCGSRASGIANSLETEHGKDRMISASRSTKCEIYKWRAFPIEMRLSRVSSRLLNLES